MVALLIRCSAVAEVASGRGGHGSTAIERGAVKWWITEGFTTG